MRTSLPAASKQSRTRAVSRTGSTLFVLSLSVSFFLSLYTASRAYNLARRELAVLGARLLRRFVQHPLDFVLPRNLESDADEKNG